MNILTCRKYWICCHIYFVTKVKNLKILCEMFKNYFYVLYQLCASSCKQIATQTPIKTFEIYFHQKNKRKNPEGCFESSNENKKMIKPNFPNSVRFGWKFWKSWLDRLKNSSSVKLKKYKKLIVSMVTLTVLMFILLKKC